MKYDLENEKRLLLLLEREDEGVGVTFSDHAYLKETARHYRKDQIEEYCNNHDLTDGDRYHFDKMKNVGLVKEHSAAPESIQIGLTLLGHERLEQHRQNVLWRRFVRLISNVFEKTATSIIVPIVVSVVTVLVMRYLGLEK